MTIVARCRSRDCEIMWRHTGNDSCNSIGPFQLRWKAFKGQYKPDGWCPGDRSLSNIEEGGGKRRPLNETVIRANCSRWYAARRPVVLVVKTTSSLGYTQLKIIGESAVDVLDASNQMKRSRF
jgi:hypothetical protein